MNNIPIPDDLALDTGDAVDAALGFRHQQRRYEAVRDGLLTRPVKFGRANRWPQHEHQAIARARISGATDGEIRTLVERLHELRERLSSEAA